MDFSTKLDDLDVEREARDVLSVWPHPTALTAERLAYLVRAAWRDHRFRSPEDEALVPQENGLSILIRRVTGRTLTRERITAMLDPDMPRLLPYAALDVEHDWCARADELRHRWLRPDDLEPVPFLDCRQTQCWCTLSFMNRRMAARKYPDRPLDQHVPSQRDVPNS